MVRALHHPAIDKRNKLFAPCAGPRSGFSLLMIVVASTTAYLVIVYPKVRNHSIVLSIYGYTYGSVLGIFLAGMLTNRAETTPATSSR